ncbi:hypothetical protein AMECASPLE_026504 [Ameca splendens]|uniref:Uncharacterized protein n=1 Tax=Ameca splendens TaxID=208324 RepID=A0ABV0Y4T5_9TELE
MINKWLEKACATKSVNFIDNFNIFREKKHLFKQDGFCLNKPGARRFTSNLFYSVNNPPAASTFSRDHGVSTAMITLPPTAPAETTRQLAERERSSQKVSSPNSTLGVDPPPLNTPIPILLNPDPDRLPL